MFTGQCFEHSIFEFEFPTTIKHPRAYLCVYLSTTLFLHSYLACLKGTVYLKLHRNGEQACVPVYRSQGSAFGGHRFPVLKPHFCSLLSPSPALLSHCSPLKPRGAARHHPSGHRPSAPARPPRRGSRELCKYLKQPIATPLNQSR